MRWRGGRTYEDNPIVTDQVVEWSPADNPEAIAVSEAQWWARAAELAVLRMRGSDDTEHIDPNHADTPTDINLSISGIRGLPSNGTRPGSRATFRRAIRKR